MLQTEAITGLDEYNNLIYTGARVKVIRGPLHFLDTRLIFLPSATTLRERDAMQDKAWYIPVLAYHEIGTEQWYYNTPEKFAWHIKWLL